MTLRSLTLPLLAAALAAACDQQTTEARASTIPAKAGGSLTVVELYQSQGCSSCPPAIRNVNALADRKDLLVLTFSVTYWDYLGWKDTYGKPAFTARQAAYASAFNGRSYTPEVVVNGRNPLVGDRATELASVIARSGTVAPLAVRATPGQTVTLAANPSVKSNADVWLVRYDPANRPVAIRAGENAGRTIDHRNLVIELTRLGRWSGEARQLPLPAASKAGLSSAVLVQAPNGGPLIAAAKLAS